MAIPVQLAVLLDDWLSNRSAYCEINKTNSKNFVVNYGTVHGPLLFALFISPPTTHADDNYLFGSGRTKKEAKTTANHTIGSFYVPIKVNTTIYFIRIFKINFQNKNNISKTIALYSKI